MRNDFMQAYKNYNFPLAVSIVVSGQYEDDLDNSENIVYTGQGGNNLLGNKRQVKDQDLLRGNLALKVFRCIFLFYSLCLFYIDNDTSHVIHLYVPRMLACRFMQTLSIYSLLDAIAI